MPCFAFDPTKGQYSAAVLFLVKAAGVLTVPLLAGAWLGMTCVRRSRSRPQPGALATGVGHDLQSLTLAVPVRDGSRR